MIRVRPRHTIAQHFGTEHAQVFVKDAFLRLHRRQFLGIARWSLHFYADLVIGVVAEQRSGIAVLPVML